MSSLVALIVLIVLVTAGVFWVIVRWILSDAPARSRPANRPDPRAPPE